MIERTSRSARKASATLVAITASLVIGAAFAQTDKVNSAISEQSRAETAAQESQKRVSQLDDETSDMLSEYRQLISEAQSLKAYNEQLGAQVKSQADELQTMTQQLTEIETTSREVLPLMQKMLATLEQFVQLDIPFLPEERTKRIADLKDMMNRADVSISEKYRRILEAYSIEVDFGRTIEAYEGKVAEKTVQFLRVGRVSLMFQTLDGKETGYWDAANKAWTIDNSYESAMAHGLKVAKKQAAPEVLVVPVPAPKEAN